MVVLSGCQWTILLQKYRKNRKYANLWEIFCYLNKKSLPLQQQIWRIYTIRIIPLCKHSEWHASVALFCAFPCPRTHLVNIPPCGEILHKTMQMWRNTLQPYAKKAVPLQFFVNFFEILTSFSSRSAIEAHWLMLGIIKALNASALYSKKENWKKKITCIFYTLMALKSQIEFDRITNSKFIILNSYLAFAQTIIRKRIFKITNNFMQIK